MVHFFNALLIALAVQFTAYDVKAQFYENPNAVFSTRPDATKSLQEIKRFGPVGIGLDLIQPAFVMRIKNIEEGSPADRSGKLKVGQIIESINGSELANIDPRIQLGNIVAEAEATEGIINFKIRGISSLVELNVPVLGRYSKTWPINCAKSDKIIRQVAEYLKRPKSTEGLGGIGMLFLLSTGDPNDQKFVHEWAKKAPAHKYPWYIGYGGIALAECYLRTGDPIILKNIQEWVDNAVSSQHNDGWAGRGSALTSYGQGHLNAAGTHVVTFLMLAKECGAIIPDKTFLGSLRHFFRYAGRGNNPYGDDRPEVGFVDNGKNGKLAFAMAAAAALTHQEGETIYSMARDVCAIQSFYTTSFMLHGHTGGGIGEIWRSAAMGLLYDKQPQKYREFMDNRQWHYDLSRRHDGSFGILGGSGYDKELWGVAYPLTYTIPRKTLRVSGAPPTKHSKPYKLPKQIWGTEEDNLFLSLEAVPEKNGTAQDLSKETLADHSSLGFIRVFHGKKQPSDEEIRQYIHHQDYNIRHIAAFKTIGINSGYIGWKSGGGKVRKDLVNEFLNHNDPRVRRAIMSAILHKPELITPKVFNYAVDALENEKESWWIKDAALQIIGNGSSEQVLPHIDLLLTYLKHEESWLRNAALTALTPVVADERCYKKILPAIGELIRNNQRVSVTRGLTKAIREKIVKASPEVQQLATKTLEYSFTSYGGSKKAPGGLDTTSTYEFHLEAIAESLASVPGGLDVLYEVSRERQPNEILPYKEFFLNADSNRFGPKLKEAINPIIMQELIPEYVGRNRENLRKLAGGEIQSGFPGGSRDAIDGLAALYDRAGDNNYDWNIFMDLREAEWQYHSFDPIASEQVPFDQLITRYREVSLPKRVEDWFNTDAGESSDHRGVYKIGKSPFGHYMGKIPDKPIHKCGSHCKGPECYGGAKVNTFWEKEVLLIKQNFKVPPIKTGYRYRLRINDGNHVGSGGGHIVYVNGKPLIETKTCNGRGSGGLPKGAYITKEFMDDFKSGSVCIALKTFLRYNDKYKVKPTQRTPQGKISLHIEEQKIPPMSDDLVFKSASLIPMLSSEWQAGQDPEDREKSALAVKYRWDGKFRNNQKIMGSWNVIGQVASVEEFDPDKRTRVNRPPFAQIAFKNEGKTNDPVYVWSNNILMDLNKFQALKMKVQNIQGKDYLFVEVGGFGTRNKPGWKSQLLVLEKK